MGRKARRLFSARLLGVCAVFGAAKFLYSKMQHCAAPILLPPADRTVERTSCTKRRTTLLRRLQRATPTDNEDATTSAVASYDLVVVGGGAAGLFCALDGAARGYAVLLVEKDDIGVASSPLQLLNGSVMHAQKGIRQRDLVVQLANAANQLSELRTLERIAPRYVRSTSMVVPFTRWNEGLELWISGKLASFAGLASTWRRAQLMSSNRFFSLVVPNADPSSTRVCGAVRVPQCMIDDTRCCVALAQTASDAGAHLLTHCRVTKLRYRDNEKCSGGFFELDASATDTNSAGGDCEQRLRCRARYIIDATGPGCGAIWKLVEGVDLPDVVLGYKQALQLVVHQSSVEGLCMGGEQRQGIVVAGEEQSARSFFVIPAWRKDYALVGAAFGPLQEVPAPINPNDVDSITAALATFNVHVDKKTVLGALRHPIAVLNPGTQERLPVVRDVARNGYAIHTMWANDGTQKLQEELEKMRKDAHAAGTEQQPKLPIVTLFGSSWTTARLMAQIALDAISAREQDGTKKPCCTRNIILRGCDMEENSGRSATGDDVPNTTLPEITDAEIEHAVDNEFCVTVVDFVARRSGIAYTHGSQLLRAANGGAGSKRAKKTRSSELLLSSTVHRVAHVMGQKLQWNANKQQAEVARAIAFIEHVAPPITGL